MCGDWTAAYRVAHEPEVALQKPELPKGPPPPTPSTLPGTDYAQRDGERKTRLLDAGGAVEGAHFSGEAGEREAGEGGAEEVMPVGGRHSMDGGATEALSRKAWRAKQMQLPLSARVAFPGEDSIHHESHDEYGPPPVLRPVEQ
jgi:hypothetical protein